MKKTKLLLALCFAGCMAHAQMIYTFAGNGTPYSGVTGGSGWATTQQVNPYDIKADAYGNIYVAEMEATIKQISTSGIITVIAGIPSTSGHAGGGYSGDNGPATAAKLSSPSSMCFDPSGNMYIADFSNNAIRKISAISGKITSSCTITTIAGNGTAGYSGDGFAATSAKLNGPMFITSDASSNIYISDFGNYRIRKITASTGIINTVAGNGTAGYTGDNGAATSANINLMGIALDGSGNIYFSDYGYNVIRKVTVSTGIITTIAGTGYNCTGGPISEEEIDGGYRSSDDGGAATLAELNFPVGISFDGSGNLYIAEKHSARIRKINTSGIISTFAGSGVPPTFNGACSSLQVPGAFSGDEGLPTSAQLNHPTGVAFDASGSCYIADNFNNRVRKISSLCPANAGLNKTVINPGACCGGVPVVIGTPAVPNMTYSWVPSTLLTPSTSTAQPTSTWSNTSTCQIYTVTVSYSLCTTATSTVQVCAEAHPGPGCCRLSYSPTGELTEGIPASLSVFPNPANGNVTLNVSDNAEYIRIVDMQGRLVFETKDVNAGEFKLDISKYNKGIYFVSAKMGDVVEKQKLIVE